MKLLEALEVLAKAPADNAEVLPVFLACGFTPLHLQTFVSAFLQRQFPQRRVQVKTGLYGDCLSTLQQFSTLHGEANVVVLEWPDLDPRLGLRRLSGWKATDLEDILNTCSMRFAQFEQSLLSAADIAPIALSLSTLPLPPVSFMPGWQAGHFELSLQHMLFKMAASVTQNPRLRIINAQALDDCSPPKERLDVKSALNFDFPYTLGHTAQLAELLARAAMPPIPFKGIITDLDNTLWQGIIGEVGAQSVSWDLDHKVQAHGLYQQLLNSLSDAGVFVAVASKNSPEVAMEGLKRPDLLLSLDRVLPIEIHWTPKSDSVSRILQTWNVGADSVVFVDDSPTELAEVTAAHPGIVGLRFPTGNNQAAYELLVQLRTLFGKSTLHAEDKLRVDSLKAMQQRTLDSSQLANDQEVFLKQTKPILTVDANKDLMDSRALELINKTNQFNLNGGRYTEAKWQEYLNLPETKLMVFSYEDKYGALGKIAVLTGRLLGPQFVVDSWVMSCRAFSRRIEYRCLQLLFQEFAVEEIIFRYQETERNGPLQDCMREIFQSQPRPNAALSHGQFLSTSPSLFFKE